MPVKLPDGFVYVGQTLSVSDSATLKVKFCVYPDYVNPYGSIESEHVNMGNIHRTRITAYARIQDVILNPDGRDGLRWRFIAFLTFEGGPSIESYIIEDFTEDYVPPGPTMPPSDKWTQEYTITMSVEPLYLGVRYRSSTTNTYPFYGCKHGVLEYSWFAGRDTRAIYTCAGHTYVVIPTVVAGIPEGQDYINVGNIAGGTGGDASIWTLNEDAVIFSDLSCNTDGLHNGCIKGEGGGTAIANSQNGGLAAPGFYSGAFTYAPPVTVTYDGRISKFGVDAPDWARLKDSYYTYKQTYGDPPQIAQPYKEFITFPADNGTIVAPCQSWTTGYKTASSLLDGISFSVDSEWAAEQKPPLPDDDLYVPIRGCPAKVHPSERGWYNPVRITLVEQDVNRPDNVKRSDWKPRAGDEEKFEVSEGATTVINVKETGGTIEKVLKTHWIHYLQKPADCPPTNPHPLWSGEDGVFRTKHRNNGDEWDEDIWSWSTYGTLRFYIKAPKAVTLRLGVMHQHVIVYDPHVTGCARWEDYDFELTEPEVDYFTIQLKDENKDPATGIYVADVDLLFPEGGGPKYLGRISKLTLSGFSAKGTYEIAGALLTQKDAAQCPGYVKVAFGPPNSRRDGDGEARSGPIEWPAFVASNDGSWVFGHVPDTLYKQDEVSAYGGSFRYVSPMMGANSGVITDSQLSINAFWAGHVGLIEGFEVEYDRDAYLAANADFDDDGETVWAALGPENADWTHPVLPNSRLKIGETWTPNVSPTCRTIIPVNGVPFNIWVDHSLAFAGVETVVAAKGGRRMPPEMAGTKVYLLGNRLLPDGSPDPDPKHQDILAEGVTDRMGYAVVYPVQADRIRNYTLVTEDELDDYELDDYE